MKQPASLPQHPVAVMPRRNPLRLWQALESSRQQQLAQCLATLLQRLAQNETVPKESVDDPA